MKHNNLFEILHQKDFKAFKDFVKSIDIGTLTEEEELLFVQQAPPKWIEEFVSNIYLHPEAERFLMTNPCYDRALNICGQMWEFYTENVLWAFQTGPILLCHKILKGLKTNPGSEVEKAMLKRQSICLFKAWLKKFSQLSEDGERMLEEDNTLMSLKVAYIEQQQNLLN